MEQSKEGREIVKCQRTNKKPTKTRGWMREKKRIASVWGRERGWGGDGISRARTVVQRRDWLCQGEISSPHIALPLRIFKAPGIKRAENTAGALVCAENRLHEGSDSCYYSKHLCMWNTTPFSKASCWKEKEKGVGLGLMERQEEAWL